MHTTVVAAYAGHGRLPGLVQLYSLLDILLETELPD
jgi:hypothetical protein